MKATKKTRRNRAPAALLCALLLLPPGPARAGTPARAEWAVLPSSAHSEVVDAYQGETVDLLCTIRGADLSGCSAEMLWQTNGMGALWWSAPATATNSTVSARWTPDCDVGAASYRFFLRAARDGAAAYRANGVIRMRPSPGFAPNALPLPVDVLDFATQPYTNAPWAEGGWADPNWWAPSAERIVPPIATELFRDGDVLSERTFQPVDAEIVLRAARDPERTERPGEVPGVVWEVVAGPAEIRDGNRLFAATNSGVATVRATDAAGTARLLRVALTPVPGFEVVRPAVRELFGDWLSGADADAAAASDWRAGATAAALAFLEGCRAAFPEAAAPCGFSGPDIRAAPPYPLCACEQVPGVPNATAIAPHYILLARHWSVGSDTTLVDAAGARHRARRDRSAGSAPAWGAVFDGAELGMDFVVCRVEDAIPDGCIAAFPPAGFREALGPSKARGVVGITKTPHGQASARPLWLATETRVGFTDPALPRDGAPPPEAHAPHQGCSGAAVFLGFDGAWCLVSIFSSAFRGPWLGGDAADAIAAAVERDSAGAETIRRKTLAEMGLE